MHKDIQEFLDYIKSARNYSDHTVKSYQNDLINMKNKQIKYGCCKSK